MKSITTLVLSVCLSGSLFAKSPVPRSAGEFRVVDSSGKSRKVSEYRGQVLVVQFLYTTCAHCQATARMLNGLQNEFGPRGLQVIGIAFEPGVQTDAIERFTKANGVSFPVGVSSTDAVLSYLGLSVM